MFIVGQVSVMYIMKEILKLLRKIKYNKFYLASLQEHISE